MMKFETTTKEFLKALDLIMPLAIRHSSVPAYECIMINATEKGTYLAAVSYGMVVTLRISARVETPGSILLPSKLLQAATAGIDGATITFTEKKSTKCLVEVGRVKTTLNGIDPLEFRQVSFPGIDTIDSGSNDIAMTPVECSTVRNAIDHVLYAAAVDENDELSNIYVEQTPSKLSFTATDRYRVAHRHLSIGSTEEFAQPIPLWAVRIFARLLKECSTVKIGYDGYSVEFLLYADDRLLAYVSIESVAITYPNYRAVIAGQSYAGTLTFVVGDFLQAVKVATPFIDSSIMFRVSIVELADGLAIECTNVKTDYGTVICEVGATVSGDIPPMIVFDYRYLKDMLDNFPVGHTLTAAVTPQGFLRIDSDNGFDFLTCIVKDEPAEQES